VLFLAVLLIQVVLLRRRVRDAVLWSVASSVWILAVFLPDARFMTIALASTPLRQWLFLRRSVEHASVWIAAMVGGIGGGLLVRLALESLIANPQLDAFFGSVALGGLAGVGTATALVWLLRRLTPDAADELRRIELASIRLTPDEALFIAEVVRADGAGESKRPLWMQITAAVNTSGWPERWHLEDGVALAERVRDLNGYQLRALEQSVAAAIQRRDLGDGVDLRRALEEVGALL
jgi:hypothetical protein